ncbi:DEKNAAC104583 [Brettanomyces naardenensis]|uniref:DEKNAAC104583 n=1 Tax=Brettanomyces naardenensis TaxID=13370 RepID=A0A448YQZ2_BRENA|nr:DEKNAAC104583 [Brettanomyces naardenensis]
MITLEHTSDWHVIRYCQSRNHENWGKPLTLDEYYKREEISYKHELCNLDRDYSKEKKGDYYWVLKDTDIDTSSKTGADPKLKNIVSACEILVRDSWYLDTENPDSEPSDCLSAVIGSVYTFSEHRSKGYASRMLQLLVEKMQDILGNPHDFSFLYSEVGEFYSNFGFKSYHVPVCIIPMKSIKELPAIDYVPLTTHFESQVELYGKKMKQLMLKEAKSGEKSVVVCLKPQQQILEWFLNRSRHTGRSLEGLTEEAANKLVYGAELSTGDFIIWLLDFTEKTAVVLMIYATTSQNVKELIKACKQLIPDGFEKIIIWQDELTDYSKTGASDLSILTFIEEELQGESGVKNSSLSALRMLHLDEDVAVKWVGNGKWSWF